LGIGAFFIGLGPDGGNFDAELHRSQYEDYRQYMLTVMGGAEVEFEQIGKALGKIAAMYDRTDSMAAMDLNKIFGQPEL
jgi:hypothetical protein